MRARFFAPDRLFERLQLELRNGLGRLDWRHSGGAVAKAIPGWIGIERERRRIFPWFAPAMGAGVLLAFHGTDALTLLLLFAALGAAAMAASLVWASRYIFLVASGALLASSLGYFAVQFRIENVASPILREIQIVPVRGVVETIDPRTTGARVVLRPTRIADEVSELPFRLRLTIKGPTQIQAGDVIEVKSRLMPPPPPSRPGGYDFSREAFFARVGGTGTLLGSPAIIKDAGFGDDFLLDFNMTVDRGRNQLAERIISVIGGDSGAIAAALVTGKRGMISDEANEALRAAGIYHIVSISGLHMVLAAGMVFWLTRLAIVLLPLGKIVLPAKSIAAIAAMVGAAAYTVFAGAEVATVRSMIMTLVLFGSVLAGRPAISIRNLAIAAMIVILLEPETLLGPSFQMSFAAVAAMIAVYERLPPSSDRPANFAVTVDTNQTPPGSRLKGIGQRLARYGKILVVTTLVAQAATGPYAAFHFQQFQPWGLIGNALTLPLVELVAMPIALAAVLALPFGLDTGLWHLMGYSMDGMLQFARMVAAWPGSVQALPAIPIASVLALSVGLIWLTFWSTPLRWGGVVFAFSGLILALGRDLPDVIVSRDGRAMAVRGSDGLLTVAGTGASDFVVKQWLLADGDLRAPDDLTVRRNGHCDDSGCLVRHKNGLRVALALRTRALRQDCELADVLITPLVAPKQCRAFIIDGLVLEQTGAVELFNDGASFRMNRTRSPDNQTLWSTTKTRQHDKRATDNPDQSSDQGNPQTINSDDESLTD